MKDNVQDNWLYHIYLLEYNVQVKFMQHLRTLLIAVYIAFDTSLNLVISISAVFDWPNSTNTNITAATFKMS